MADYDPPDPTAVTLYPGEALHVQTPVASPTPPADITVAYARALELRYKHDYSTMLGYLIAYEEFHGLEHRTMPRPRILAQTYTFTVVDNKTYTGKDALEARVRRAIFQALEAAGMLSPHHEADWFIKGDK